MLFFAFFLVGGNLLVNKYKEANGREILNFMTRSASQKNCMGGILKVYFMYLSFILQATEVHYKYLSNEISKKRYK